MTKDLLRNLILTGSHAKVTTVQIGEHTFELRSPSIAERSEIVKASSKPDKNGEVDINFAKLQVTAVICLTYVPGTNDKVFTAADEAALMQTPAGGLFDQLAEVAVKLVNVKDDRDPKN